MNPKIKIYVAASFKDRLIVRLLEDRLASVGFEIVSHWTEHYNKDEAEKYANEDIEAIRKADALVVYNGTQQTVGKITEIGMAIYKGVPVYIFGEPYTSVFRFKTEQIGWDRIKSIEDIVNILTYKCRFGI